MTKHLIESIGVKVVKEKGEEIRKCLARLELLNRDVLIKKEGEHLLIPVSRAIKERELEELKAVYPQIEVVKTLFKAAPHRPKDLMEALKDLLPPYKLASLPGSFDIIGDIVVIEIPPELEGEEALIAEGIMRIHPHVKSIYKKAGAVEGEFRVRPLKFIGGIDKPVTVHKEHGCLFKVDLKEVYFSPRLATERRRVVELVNSREVVVDLFSGVGPYAIQIAKFRGAKVYAVDINPRAYQLLLENIRVNKVQDRVEAVHGDARQVASTILRGIADRVIMNHPSQALDFLDAACLALKPEGGVIHVYTFAHAFEDIEDYLARKIRDAGRRVYGILHRGFVRQVAPREWQVVIDVKVR
ncbi:MAG: hypothetical protein DRJ98_00565 [Thermoprotei archaeon]|nr:MAG: hypothetical protein DRJ98_00565 [Thermoprotei archaeon]RLF17913.1 MAG: hypothetical protein DRN06_02855 [Thermoprotei archaeon]